MSSSPFAEGAGYRLAKATTVWPFAWQWRIEKNESLPPEINAMTFKDDAMVEKRMNIMTHKG
jgi:hypothetical protein